MFFSKASMNRDFFSNNKVGEKLTLYYDELKEAIDRGYIKGDTVQIIRKNGLVFSYVLPNEPVEFYELAAMHVYGIIGM
ncbi:paratox [Streptococcus gallolyticus]|uniref:Paratox n=2 Tax=Streptococcus gallolyticus TaxID=315405 RepID=A0AA94M1V6_9STRE|nr:putative phage protein [Streptococcus gallolyticus subsp. gallolyticus DSM 16831]SQG78815.1 paratox [Streptococcus gallolyticus]